MLNRKPVQRFGRAAKTYGHRIRKLVTITAILLVLWPYTASFGDEGVSFTLVNGTSRFLHAVINGKPFVYIAPGAVIVYQLGGYANVTASVSYSPGQNVKGRTTKTFQTVVETVNNYSSNHSHDCSGSQSGNTCSSSTEAAGTATTSVRPITWSVAPSDLSSN